MRRWGFEGGFSLGGFSRPDVSVLRRSARELSHNRPRYDRYRAGDVASGIAVVHSRLEQLLNLKIRTALGLVGGNVVTLARDRDQA